MADFAPPSGPPPPKVPEGWKAVWNPQYSEWFYVNLYTKQSQWEKPTEPAYPPKDHAAPNGPPPSYSGGNLGTNNPYASGGGSADEQYARELQAEEEARARSHGQTPGAGSSNDYYQQGPPGGSSQYGQQQYPQQGHSPAPQQQQPQQSSMQSKGKGLLGKLLSKASAGGSSHSRPQGYGYPHQPSYGSPYGNSAYGHSYPPHGGGMYGGGGYGRRPGGGGMGAAGAGALGLGGGLLAGSMLADAGDGGGDYGGDYGDDGGYGGGDDFGGGDMDGGGGE